MTTGGEHETGRAAEPAKQAESSQGTEEEKPRRRTTRRTAKPDDERTLPSQEAPEATMVRPDLGVAKDAGEHGVVAGTHAGRAGGGEASAAAGEHPNPTMQRAEEMIDRMGERISQFVGQARGEAASGENAANVEAGASQAGERVGRFISALGLGAMRAASRAREEVEDIWAEAQNVRHGPRK